MPRNSETGPKDKAKRTRAIIAFSNIGFQMLVTILLFNRLGVWLDGRSESEAETWTLALTLGGVGVALYFMIKGLYRLIK